MNTALKLLRMFSVIPIFLLSSCQQEIEPVTPILPDQVIRPDAEVADLIKRVAIKDGSADNILDHSSYTSIALPYTVVANNVKLVIENPEDVYEVERIIDRYDDDADNIEILFPVTIIMHDYTEVLINSEEELEVMVSDYTENELDPDIECIDFVYPFGITVHDTIFQSVRILSMENDKDLYNFLTYPGENEVFGLSFPIFLVDFNGKTFYAGNNQELKDRIKTVEGMCDEDDDNDYDDDDVNTDYFRSILIYGEWDDISPYFYFIQESNPFDLYTFNFHNDGIVEIMKSDQFWEGTWSANGDAGWIQLKLDLGDNPPLNILNNDWRVIHYYPTYMFISLDESGEGSSNIIARYVNLGGLNLFLESKRWSVKSYTNYGEDKTGDYEGIILSFKMDFETGGEIVVFKDDEVMETTCAWSIVDYTAEGIYIGMSPLKQFKLNLDFGELSPLNDFNSKQWELVNTDCVGPDAMCAYSSIELFYFDSESGIITDVLILEAL